MARAIFHLWWRSRTCVGTPAFDCMCLRAGNLVMIVVVGVGAAVIIMILLVVFVVAKLVVQATLMTMRIRTVTILSVLIIVSDALLPISTQVTTNYI